MNKTDFFPKQISNLTLIIFTALFLIVFDNIAFFSNVLNVYPLNLKNAGFLASLAFGFAGVIVLLLTLLCSRHLIKPVVITLLIVSSFTSYFMDSYNTVIDDSMINNIINTDYEESLDLLSFKLIVYVSLLGVLPSYLVYKMRLSFRPGWGGVMGRVKLFIITLVSVVAVVFVFSDFYSSFIREHKPLRFYSNPSYYIYSIGKYIHGLFKSTQLPFKTIGLDAKIAESKPLKKLVIFVVGETARADRFSLNGYPAETNPLLKKQDIVSFTNFWSCGTSTAVSVPCMFSRYNASEYSKEKAQTTENVLDVLTHAGVNVLWLDNNSDSKNVADRVPYLSYKNPDLNSVCDPECRDVGMLRKLDSYINEHRSEHLFIVLHQMGNHGPAYYKRYPAAYEKFTPVCKTNQLEDCSIQELNNAYDNAILYTDYFLSEVIGFLKQNSEDFETAMFYVSDHGESLGENGLYLHGLPNYIAPDSQRHVSAVLWLGSSFTGIDKNQLNSNQGAKYSHDHVFHTILGLMGVETSVYDKNLDILPRSAKPPSFNVAEKNID